MPIRWSDGCALVVAALVAVAGCKGKKEAAGDPPTT